MSEERRRQKLWLVWSGEYSDKSLDGIYESLEDAETYVKAWNEMPYSVSREYKPSIEETSINQPLHKNRFLWYVHFSAQGNITFIHCAGVVSEMYPIDINPPDREGRMVVYAHADDEETATKIAAEKRAHYLASQAGMT